MGRPGVVTAPPADALALFSPDNPASLFSGLEEIGHGNFGAVYQVRQLRTLLRMVPNDRVFHLEHLYACYGVR